jgi:hypothetical protein
MLKAHVRGLIDYSRYDPDDKLWPAYQRAILSELHDQLMQEVFATHHRHATSLLPIIAERSRQDAVATTTKLLNNWWRLQTPWDAASIGVDPDTDAAQTYAQEVGKPGEARYEEAMRQLDRELAPLSPAEKLRRRRLRRQAKQTKIASQTYVDVPPQHRTDGR